MLKDLEPQARQPLTIALDLPGVKVGAQETTAAGAYLITVESVATGIPCQHCHGYSTQFHGWGRWLELRHLDILGRPTYIRLRPKQYACRHCGGRVTTETLPWYTPRSPHTHAYDEHLLLQLVNSTVEDVSRKAGVGYEAVVGALQRRVASTVDWATLHTLPVLGIDEIALTKGHRNFVAIITVQQAAGQVQVLAVLPDREKATVRAFLERIPQRLWPTLKTVCTDMWAGYIHAVEEFAAAHPEVQVVVTVDRYHVATHYRDGVETLRKTEWRRLKKTLSEAEYAEMVKGQHWLLRKNHRNLTKEERASLRKLFAHSPALHRAYTLREELTAIFERRLNRAAAAHRLRQWAAKVRRSGLTCFDKFLKTLAHWWDNILNYFIDRRNSGFVEGVNNKIKTLKRRCYGILRVTTLFQRITLDLEGYQRFA